MSSRTVALLGLLSLGFTPLNAAGLPPQHIVVTVLDKHVSPAKPVSGIRVAITFFDGLQQVTDDRQRTNTQGQIELNVSPEAAQRADLRIVIFDAKDLVIYTPSEGVIKAIPNDYKLTLELLPKGSPGLLDPPHLEAMLDRLSRLTIQNKQLAAAVQKAESDRPGFDQAVKEWADQNGLSYDDVNQKLQGWASDVLASQAKATTQKRAEAELALRHYDRAAILFRKLADDQQAELDNSRNAILQQRLEKVRTLVQNRSQEAKMDQEDRDYHGASDAMTKALNSVVAERELFPTYAPLRDVWVWTSMLAEYTRWKEGQGSLTDTSGPSTKIFTNLISESKSLVAQLDPAKDGFALPYTQLIVATASIYLAEMSGNSDANALRAQALAAAQSAVNSVDKQTNPDDWASFEGFYGTTLAAIAARGITDGHLSITDADHQLGKSIDTMQAALAMYSPQRQPKEWAQLNTILAGTLMLRGSIPGERNSKELLDQSEAAARASLANLSAKDDRSNWAEAQEALGSVLEFKAQHSTGSQAMGFFTEAEAAYGAAIDVRSKDSEPIKLANAQQNLASLLQDQAEQVQGPQAIGLLKRSVETLQAEAKLVPKEGFPQRWARIQSSLGHSFSSLAIRVSGQEANDDLDQAATAYRNTLKVFNRQEYPARWATAQALLGGVLGMQGNMASGNQALLLLGQAADAYSASLEVVSKDDPISDWAGIETNLCRVHAMQGRHAQGDQAKDFYLQTIATCDKVIQAQPQNVQLLGAMSGIAHDNLMDFPKAYDYAKRAVAITPDNSNKLNYAEAALTTSHFSECIDAIGSVDTAQLEASSKPGRLALLLACQWGANRRNDAAKTAQELAAGMASAPQFGWNSAGDLVYLGSAPEFKADRDQWIGLFKALENRDASVVAAVATALGKKAGN